MLVARRAIEKADVAVLVVDATEGATDQDAAIAGEAEKAGCGVIIAANKWDLMKGRGAEFSKTFDEELRRQLKFLDYAPLLHISAIDRRADRQGARDHRQGGRGADAADSDRRAEPLRPGGHRRPPARQPGPPAGPHPLRRADQRRTRRRSCSSPTSRPSSTFPTSGSWSTGCGSRSACWEVRSGFRSGGGVARARGSGLGSGRVWGGVLGGVLKVGASSNAIGSWRSAFSALGWQALNGLRSGRAGGKRVCDSGHTI